MTPPARFDPAAAGVTLLGTIVLFGAIGVGIGVLVGSPAIFVAAGVLAGAIAGCALVYARYRHI